MLVGLASPPEKPFPEPTNYSYRKIVIQESPNTLALVHASTYPLNTGGPWGLARRLPLLPRAKGTQEGGCPCWP